jgi:hypothetical protein
MWFEKCTARSTLQKPAAVAAGFVFAGAGRTKFSKGGLSIFWGLRFCGNHGSNTDKGTKILSQQTFLLLDSAHNHSILSNLRFRVSALFTSNPIILLLSYRSIFTCEKNSKSLNRSSFPIKVIFASGYKLLA